MARKDLDYLVIAAMLVSGLYVATTGLVMDFFGLHRAAFHPYAGYTLAVLVGLHLILNWRRITIYLRRRFQPKASREPAARGETSRRLRRRDILIPLAGAIGGFLLGGFIRWRPATPAEGSEVAVPRGDMGAFYHQWSKPGHSLATEVLHNWGENPERYKNYPGAQRFPLPDPHGYQGLSLEDSIERRRSVREYAAQPLSMAELSRLLHAAQGITDQRRVFRAAPSAGALYPMETYAVVHDVTELAPGLYHYAVVDHALEQLRVGNLRAEIMLAGIGQEMLGQAQVCFVLSAIFQRTRWRYRERTYRYVMLEAGHIGQNLYLAATSMGLGACAIGAFLDDDLNGLLGIDGLYEAALYIISVGRT